MKHCISIGAGFPLVYFDWSKIVWLFLNFLQDINKIIFHETEILCTLKWSSETMLRIAPFLCIYLFAQQSVPTYAGIFKAQRYIPPLTWQARGVCVHCTFCNFSFYFLNKVLCCIVLAEFNSGLCLSVTHLQRGEGARTGLFGG